MEGRELAFHEAEPYEWKLSDSGKALAGSTLDALERVFYPSGTSLLHVHQTEHLLGTIDLPEASVGQDIAVIASGVKPGEKLDHTTLSLGWLDRAATVDVPESMGLARHWLDGRRSIRLTPLHDRLVVTITYDDMSGSRQTVKYDIVAGQDGPIGPLWVEYRS